tara:strand:+ start:167 stop:910 length:744 start_codon:yes stop_codon:yes gene_type:complete
MRKGENKKTFAYFEEIPYLKVDEYSSPAYIFKRFDTEVKKSIEDKTFYVGIPVPKSRNGKRLYLRTTSRDRVIQLASEEVVNIRTQLAQGLKIKFTSPEKLVIDFLKFKKTLVRGEWDIKKDAGRKSITKLRYQLIESKLRNYFLPFVGEDSNAKSLSYKKFDKEWRQWRKSNPSGRGKRKMIPKESTILDEMGNIREVWKWGQMNGYIAPSERKPFDYENLIPDDEVRRDTWELSEWSDFKDDMSK